MKKILITCYCAFICCVIHAQSIDKFVLGEKRMLSISHVPSGFKYVTTNDPNMLVYRKQSSDSPDGTTYRMTFRNEILCDLEKEIAKYDYFSMPEHIYMDIYTNLIEQYGEPQRSISGSSYLYSGWELPDSRLTLRYSWNTRQRSFLGRGLFDPPEVRTVYNINIKIKWTSK